ncbi:MAG: membrane protein insertion efficiency factor YidD [Rikenellaceae bacterium]
MHYAKYWNILRSVIRRVAIFPLVVLVQIYRNCISPFTPPSCRFTPTCSEYALEALRKHGVFRGSWLTIVRISKCHPWGGSGEDPVP